MKVSSEGVLVPQKHMDPEKGIRPQQAEGEALHKPDKSPVMQMTLQEPDPDNRLSDWCHARESQCPSDFVLLAT